LTFNEIDIGDYRTFLKLMPPLRHEDERTALAEIGSEWFERLSRGRYRFADDGSFDVVDLMAAEHPRRSATLSGGETFLASLSLALALADMVTQGGGRLDAFFLDEGFGSLDEEHLDLAMEGIERLVTDAEDRLVVIVSHVPALRERIEDLIVLDRNAATGDTVVRSGAAASMARA
ncbi:MAG: SbcC/MukB-like Walker B domain-containing protein, partial [Chloroflexota bacterium]